MVSIEVNPLSLCPLKPLLVVSPKVRRPVDDIYDVRVSKKKITVQPAV